MAGTRDARRRFAEVFDADMARALRGEGCKRREIAELYGVAQSAVGKVIAGIVCPINHIALNARAANAHNIRKLEERGASTRALFRKYRAAGLRHQDIAEATGFAVSYVEKKCGNAKPRHYRGKPFVLPRERKSSGFAVPLWADRAGLAQDYRDFCREFDEHTAARECRRLKAEASRACL